MTIIKCREIIDNIKDELRNQVSLWNYQLTRDRAMNLSLQRKAENAIEKSKILQKLRIKHAERLLNDLEFGNSVKKDLEKEIQTYWIAIVPDIKDALKSFREINDIRKFQHRIHTLEVPEELDVKNTVVTEPESEPDIKSVITNVTRCSNESTLPPLTGNLSHGKAPTRRSKSRHKLHR